MVNTSSGTRVTIFKVGFCSRSERLAKVCKQPSRAGIVGDSWAWKCKLTSDAHMRRGSLPIGALKRVCVGYEAPTQMIAIMNAMTTMIAALVAKVAICSQARFRSMVSSLCRSSCRPDAIVRPLR